MILITSFTANRVLLICYYSFFDWFFMFILMHTNRFYTSLSFFLLSWLSFIYSRTRNFIWYIIWFLFLRLINLILLSQIWLTFITGSYCVLCLFIVSWLILTFNSLIWYSCIDCVAKSYILKFTYAIFFSF
jgi:hypothetical protein